MTNSTGVFRIGEVSRRADVAVPTLRAWERRYELLEPTRTEGGHRLYSEADVQRVIAMRQLIDDGWSAAAAAREVTRIPERAPRPAPTGDAAGELRDRLRDAFESYDKAQVDAALDEVFLKFEVATALEHVVMPVIRWLGEGWEADAGNIAREHIGSNLVRPRLLRLLRTPLSAGAPGCILAAPEREEHDLGLVAAAAVAAGAGWLVTYLGPRTPNPALELSVGSLRPRAVLVGAAHRDPAEEFVEHPPDLGGVPVLLGGAGFVAEDAEQVRGAVYFGGPLTDLPGTLASLAS